MATLKVRYGGEGYRWYTGVRSIQCMGAWDVDDPTNPAKGHEWGPTVGGNDLVQGSYECGSFDETQKHAQLLAVQVGPRTDAFSGEVYVLIPSGEAWLMGDDGRTIDRIP